MERTKVVFVSVVMSMFLGAFAHGQLRIEDRGSGSPLDRVPADSGATSISEGAVPGSTPALSFESNEDVTATLVRVNDVLGDHDGFPDTNETVDLYLLISNQTRSTLDDVVVEIATDDPKIDCIEVSSVVLGTLAAGEERIVPSPFVLHVHPRAERSGPAVTCVDPGPDGRCSNFVRVPGGCIAAADCVRSVAQDYAVVLQVLVASDPPLPALDFPRRREIVLDLDLDSAQAAGITTTFTEGFESGLGVFTLQTLDGGRATNALSDGYRCQYNDPDLWSSNSYGEAECYLGFVAGQSPLNAWHSHTNAAPDGGRAYLGTRSVHYGLHTSNQPDLDTTPLSQLDALRTSSPVHLAARVCRDDPAANRASCNSAADCASVGGGPCVSATPRLTFKQQVSLVDSRSTGTPFGQAADRAVVQVKRTASTAWQNLQPYVNIYDVQGTDWFTNCMFDPIDDASDEDDYFDPSQYGRLGPSSTCMPEFVFAYLGDTDEPFDLGKIGRASEGPGLLGSVGIGTWVASEFDLSRFRGQSVDLRFLVTTIKVSDFVSHEALFQWNPEASDDGWYVDDVRITQTTTTQTTLAPDLTDNASLSGNVDGDLRGDACDCAPADPLLAGPTFELQGLRWQSVSSFQWKPSFANAADVYDVLRGILAELPVGMGASETCLASDAASASAIDVTNPPAGAGFWYLVRSSNSCSTGTWGFEFFGRERTSNACP